MNRAGKILVQNLKVLVTGSNSRLGTSLTNTLLKRGGRVMTADQRTTNLELGNHKNNSFKQIDLSDEPSLQAYLQQIDPIDAVVNCAGYKSSYNYFLSYIISKNALHKFRDNQINEFGCKGCIVNLINLNGNYNQQYFAEQEEFLAKSKIDQAKIDEEVYKLADQLTAERIRCNTVMVEDKSNVDMFCNLITHILEDQYIAGQIINMEDNIEYKKISLEAVHAEIHKYPKSDRPATEPYVPPRDRPISIAAPPDDSLPKLS